jgi:hypothetical protein
MKDRTIKLQREYSAGLLSGAPAASLLDPNRISHFLCDLSAFVSYFSSYVSSHV